ncbi:arsenite efflux transporter metallochaperone ArsD [Plesiomonas shigelloides]|uniref:arsenite efflux transporter metallochaperone ArsD n=1 Tax=Plesiomonas shigelloides TaxID=703 RepID=UPI0012618D74|nr:arsenite efflux transporter metallochaperone ArsD [Plesiomonas shigelloides]KAB7695384.1 arsenite efflux transporter metallochaperone ArsD [Plesiomonas shigelloides]KAB7703091.1 arsenite efflux transporter metallochaperone ArsD [Plesiomonas shigelloides]
MRQIQVFDPALCCSSGVCGTDVDQALVTFSGDVEWLKQQGATLHRYNLAQQPMVFAQTPAVAQFLELSGVEGLPIVLVDGHIVLTGRYPNRTELARYAGLAADAVAGTDTAATVGEESTAAGKVVIKGIIKKGCCSGSSDCC